MQEEVAQKLSPPHAEAPLPSPPLGGETQLRTRLLRDSPAFHSGLNWAAPNPTKQTEAGMSPRAQSLTFKDQVSPQTGQI